MDLAGTWTLSDGTQTVPMRLPGDAITALMRAGVIPDPYFGRNEYACRWVAERDWTATRTFTVDQTNLHLEIDMLDTVATVFVNGQAVLQADTVFRRHVADLSPVLRPGKNEISIQFASSVRVAAERQAALPFPVPYAAQNCPIPNGNMLRKPACDFGWDWNIALAPFGVYGDIRLVPGRAGGLSRITVDQTHAPGQVTVAVRGLILGDAAVPVTVSLCGQSIAATVNGQHFGASIVVDDPDLWWPAGLGAQPLFDLVLSQGDAAIHRRIGFRTLDHVTGKDAAGTGFKFRVNGHDVFARGANWIPADALASNITPQATRALLQSAVDANMNMIRVWGGGRYEPDWFYDQCDEMGLMVWQDFMFACNLYPSTDDFLAEVGAEVAEQAIRLHHHTCVALWCGDNELVGALTWFEESRKDRDRYLVSYDRLNRTVEMALKAQVPGANWWPSSPSTGPLSFGDAWHDDSSGDMHFWSVWHEGRDFDHYRDVRPRFCSEFGFQSYPSMQVIAKFADPADWNIASPVMESHQKNAGGNARIAETMFRTFRFPVDFPHFVYLSQVQQGLAIKTAVTAWRALKPHCMGALIWQLNDTWPVCSWSSLDHGGNWKLLHHMARHFFAPVTVVAVPDGGDLVLRGINDTAAAVGFGLTVSALDMGGMLRVLTTVTAVLPTDAAVDLARLPRDALRPDEVLHWAWDGPHTGSDLMPLLPWKAYDLLPPGMTMATELAGDAIAITLTTRAFAPFVAVESDLPGRFSDNAFAMIPGQPRRITFAPDGPGVPAFTLRHLHAATYGT